MFEDIARVWLEGRTGMQYDDMVLNELVDDLAVVLMEVYEAGRSYGYDEGYEKAYDIGYDDAYMEGYSEGLEENLSELQW